MASKYFLRFPNFKTKALTFSYDDGTIFDRKLVEIFNKYGVKATFNLNSGFLSNDPNGERVCKDELKSLYLANGHEVAVHGVQHMPLAQVDSTTALTDILCDRINLERLTGDVVKGMAYAYGSFNDEVVDLLKKCGIVYARTTETTEKFDIPSDWLRMPATCHHSSPKLMQLAQEFVACNKDVWTQEPKLFYVWGHSYEFDRGNCWSVIEDFCKVISNKDDIWYATNMEICRYVKAFESLEFSANNMLVYNPSNVDVCISYIRKDILIPAGKTVGVYKLQ